MDAASTGAVAGGESDRMKIARLAIRAATRHPGVVQAWSGPLASTADARARVDGVVVAAEAEGAFSVSLRLVALPVALPALMREVQAAVRRASERAGLGQRVGSVSVRVEDVVQRALEAAGPAA